MGSPGQSDKKALTLLFLSSAYFTEVKWLISKKTIIFQGSRGVQHFPGEGSNCLIPIETYITCDFPGGGGGGPDSLPPLDPHLHKWINSKLSVCTHQAVDGLASNPALASVIWCATGIELTSDHFLIFINDLSDNRAGLLFLGSKF